MDIEKKLVKVGSSLGIVIDKVFLESLNLKEGDKLIFEIKNKKNE